MVWLSRLVDFAGLGNQNVLYKADWHLADLQNFSSGLGQQTAGLRVVTGEAGKLDLQHIFVRSFVEYSYTNLLLDSFSVDRLLGALVNWLNGEADAVRHFDNTSL